MKTFFLILGLFIAVPAVLAVIALCILSSRISREEERKEFLNYEINREDV